MALTFYTATARKLVVGSVFDLVANTLNLMIMTSTYTFSAAHDFRDDITNEVTGTGYTAGGLALANKSVSSANPAVFTADDIVVAQSGAGFSTGRKYAIVKITGGASSTDPLFAYGTAGADFGNVAGALTLDVPASFVTLTA
jgi:hypothetical protein